MVAPTGVPYTIEITNPIDEHTTERIAEQIVTDLNVLYMRMADSAGKIISADTSRAPTRFIARTMITAITIAIRRLNVFTLEPTERAKFSSKVTANILL